MADETDPHSAQLRASLNQVGAIRIGHDRAWANVVLPVDQWVSGRHAEIRRRGSGAILVDLEGGNGLHYKGRRVQDDYVTLAPGDIFTIGRHQFRWDGQALYDHDDKGGVSIIIDRLSVEVKGKKLLDDVSFTLRHGTLLGVIGPSGCGKSTLLRAITGSREPTNRRSILYFDKPLYDHYDELRYRIGLVPQDDVLHRQLTVRSALRFAASLRPAVPGTERRGRRQRVDEVISLLGMSHRATHPIHKLSGGQRKRTSVAMELLTEPSLLALDEPTSGLDPALDKELMEELRRIADGGTVESHDGKDLQVWEHTVMVVTHSVLHLDVCDYVLVMCLGGRMGYFGPPNELLPFFESADYADVFHKITHEADYWAEKYRSSEQYRRYVTEPKLRLLDEARRGPQRDQDDPTISIHATETIAAVPTQAAPPASEYTDHEPDEPPTGEMQLTPEMIAAVQAPHAAPPSAVAEPAPAAAPTKGTPRGGKATSVLNRNLDKMAAVVFRDSPKTSAAASATSAASTASAASARTTTAAKTTAPTAAAKKAAAAQEPVPAPPLRQYFTLTRRMLRVTLSDRGYTVFLLALPVALALLSKAIPGSAGLLGREAGDLVNLEAQRRLAVFIVGASFMGVAVAIRSIIGEADIYGRERAMGQSPTAYLASKVTIFVIIDAIQVVLFIYLSMWGLHRPQEPLIFDAPLVDIIIAVWLVAVASTAFALFASAMVKSTDQTTPIMVVSVMFQLVLSGALFAVHGTPLLEYLAYLDPARWGMAASAASVNMPYLPKEIADPIWYHRQENWLRACAILGAQILVLLVATRLALRRYEPGKS